MTKTTLQPYKKYNAIAYDYASQLPDGWQLLPNIAIFQERKESGTENEENLTISSIRGIVKSSDYENRKDRTSDDKSQYLLVHEGDLAYNTMLMWDGAVGHSSFKGIVSPAYTVLKAKMKINPKFFHYQMRTEFYKNYSRRFSYGIVDARLRLYYVHFKRMYSIVPPISVQNSIVAYLDKKNNEIDKFIRNKERLIELLNQSLSLKVDASFKSFEENLEMVSTNNSGFPFIPKYWTLRKLKHLTTILSCGVASTPEYVDEENGVLFLSAQNVKPFRIVLDKCSYITKQLHKKLTTNKKTQNGDILMTRIGGASNIGDACIVELDSEFSIYVSLTHIRVTHKILPQFLLYYFQTFYCKTMNVEETLAGGGQGNLNIKSLEKYKVPVPPISEQISICNYLDIEREKINNAISKAQQEISSIKEYREALITDLIMGKRSVPQLQIS